MPLSGIRGYQETLRSPGAAQLITLQGLPFFTVRFKTRHQQLSCLRSSNAKIPIIMVGFSLFPSKLSHHVLSTYLYSSKSPTTWYIMPCNFLIIVSCRILPCSTMRILSLTNTPGMAPNRGTRERVAKKNTAGFYIKIHVKTILEHQCVFCIDCVVTVSTAFSWNTKENK